LCHHDEYDDHGAGDAHGSLCSWQALFSPFPLFTALQPFNDASRWAPVAGFSLTMIMIKSYQMRLPKQSTPHMLGACASLFFHGARWKRFPCQEPFLDGWQEDPDKVPMPPRFLFCHGIPLLRDDPFQVWRVEHAFYWCSAPFKIFGLKPFAQA
jgi:hypothetical protein